MINKPSRIARQIMWSSVSQVWQGYEENRRPESGGLKWNKTSNQETL
jgi:hypothetical protein